MNKKLSLTLVTLLSVGALLAACGEKATSTTTTETKAAEPATAPTATAEAAKPADTTAATAEAAKPADTAAPTAEAAKPADATAQPAADAAATAQTSPTVAATEAAAAPAAAGSSNITSLQSTDVKAGTGAEAVAGKAVSVHYTGWLYDEKAADKHGAQFDSSHDRDEPFEFTLGGGQVIQGWDQGVVGMKVGGQRTLIIPASLAYGEMGAGGGLIPPNASLVFDVELLDVK
jgi:FKBP-type peptidyl-prolyl cis-trans isomerase